MCYFQVGAIMNTAAINVCVEVLCEHFSSCRVNAQEWNPWVICFKRTVKLLQSGCTILHTHSSEGELQYSAFSPTFGIASIFYFSPSSGYVVGSHCGFISLMTNNIEQTFHTLT